MLSEGEVKEGNRVWHVDSGLNPAGALNGQLLKFNCWSCLLGRPSEHLPGYISELPATRELVESLLNPVSRGEHVGALASHLSAGGNAVALRTQARHASPGY